MKIGAVLDRLNRVQRAFWFKVGASILVLALAITVVTVHAVRMQAERKDQAFRAVESPSAQPLPEETVKPDATDAEKAEAAQIKAYREAQKTAAEATVKALNRMLEAKTDPTAVAMGAAIIAGLALGVIWLGQALTVLGILIGPGLVSQLLVRYGAGRWADAGWFIAALGSLALSFVILMELLRVLFSSPTPVVAIARNVVNEAVRIKVSLIFIVLLLFALAALPGMLDASTPLRYRVQSFLQYGTGGSFWIIAILVLFLAVSSVTFEQRDRVIWQTMTKPVAPWQYILGKWLGVVGVAAVLLAVSTSGVFLFTEYLSDQTAIGEVRPYVPADRSGDTLITEDRLILESQVLTARDSVRPQLPELDPQAVAKEIQERVVKASKTDENFRDTDAARAKLLNDYREERRAQFYAIGGGDAKIFEFKGLLAAKESGSPLTLRYKVDVGANDPKVVHRVTFGLPNAAPVVQVVPLGQMMTLNVSPASIDSKGKLELRVLNGDYYQFADGAPPDQWKNKDTMSFPPDGLEVYFPVGGYQANYLRVVVVLWMKLAFLAMVAVCAATFLSFAVASLVAFGTFLIAESAKYLYDSLEYYASTTDNGQIDFFRVAVRAIAVPISRAFHFYSSLRPTANLVEGRVIPWTTVGLAAIVLGLLTLLLYGIAVAVFRRRELAMYSGQ